MAMSPLLYLLLLGGCSANMYDVLEPTKLPPKECSQGCASWASQSPDINKLWTSGNPPTDASNHCAQPGLGVDTYKYGSWCRCVKPPHPSPGPPPLDPDHPLDALTFTFYNTFASQNLYVGFPVDSEAPPAEPAGSKARSWFRATYTDQKEATPIKLEAVAGKKDVYVLYNMWGDSEYQHYLGADTNNTGFVSSGALYTAQNALQVQLIQIGDNSSSKYSMRDLSTGLYLSYCDGGCSGGKWLRVDYNSSVDAMIVEFVPSGAAPSTEWGYCVSDLNTPEQVNIQIAAPTTVVVSFVTFEAVAPTSPPVLKYGLNSNLDQTATGVSHVHVTPAGDRTYYMHFVELSGLAERSAYSYTVQSGGVSAKVSQQFEFKSGYSTGVTRVGIYGDMGVYSWNNMGNLFVDKSNGLSDMIVHMGDHAYNEGDQDERRADGYMSAFQPILASVPWMPVVGNHEYYSGEMLSRFLNQTWGGHPWEATATSALGAMLARGNHHAAGMLGSTPSNTSRFFSADFGLIHFVALDLNMYFGTDACGDPCKQAQMAWLAADLEKANGNRDAVPWVVAMSHFPFYCTGCQGEMNAAQGSDSAPEEILARYYESFRAELYGNANYTAQNAMLAEEALDGGQLGVSNNRTVKQAADAVINDLMPIVHAGGVDLYAAGHWHYYESIWPSAVGATGRGGEVYQNDFNYPNVTVHVTTGNGGPPGPDNFREDCKDPQDCGALNSTRRQSVNFGYGRLIAHNASHLQFSQVRNNDSVVEDDWTIVQNKHGPRSAL